MALIVAVGALNARPIGRLGALTTGVTELVAVTALDLGHVARLRALLGNVALLIAVAAGDNTLLLALPSTVALLAAVAADVRLAVRAVASEVAGLVAVLALDVVHVRRLRTLLGDVALLSTVATATATTLLARLGAVAGTVTDLVAVDALLDDLLRLALLLVAPGLHVADFATVIADDDEAVHWEASFGEASKVLLRGGRPAFGEDGTPRLSRPLDGHGVLLVGLALEVDEGPVDSDLLLLSDQVGIELLVTEGELDLFEGGVADRFGVDEESLRDDLLIMQRNNGQLLQAYAPS